MVTVSDTNGGNQRGTSYIRWGRKTCENNATLVYVGVYKLDVTLSSHALQACVNSGVYRVGVTRGGN